MKKFNINISDEFQSYAIRQIGFILFITFLFFVMFMYNFGLVMATFIIWAFLVMAFFFIYLDIKFMYKVHKIEDEIKNIKYVLRYKK